MNISVWCSKCTHQSYVGTLFWIHTSMRSFEVPIITTKALWRKYGTQRNTVCKRIEALLPKNYEKLSVEGTCTNPHSFLGTRAVWIVISTNLAKQLALANSSKKKIILISDETMESCHGVANDISLTFDKLKKTMDFQAITKFLSAR